MSTVQPSPALQTCAPRQFKSLQELKSCVGQEVALSDWLLVSQERINQFAQATGDFQWIHVDEVRAKSGPFGSTIAHGYLTLSLVVKMFEDSVQFTPLRFALNYGVNKVRFTAPVPAGSRLRARSTLAQVEQLGAEQQNAWQSVWDIAVEREGAAKPVCLVQSVIRLYE
jgi:acyl dehydratase